MPRKILLFILLGGMIAFAAGMRACHQVPAIMGDATEPRPLEVVSHIQHPFLAESERSSMHGGAHNWDINTYPGPLGFNTSAKHRKFSNIIGVAPNISFDSKGRLITVSIQLNRIELHLLNPETLATLAMLELPAKASPSDNSGGGYFHLDAQDRVLLAPANNTISIYEIDEPSGGPVWVLNEGYDITGLLPEGINIHDVIPDWSGNLWFVTGGAHLGYRANDTGEFHVFELPAAGETIQNSFAVDEEGLYVASTDAIYQFKIDAATKEPYYTWREDYDNGAVQKPGTLSHGSGTSPTLIGSDLVAIADDGDPFTNIVVYKKLICFRFFLGRCSETIQHAHRLSCRCTLIQQGGICKGHGGQFTNHRLKIENGLKSSLSNFGLIGCIGGVPSRVLKNISLDCSRKMGGVIPHTNIAFVYFVF